MILHMIFFLFIIVIMVGKFNFVVIMKTTIKKGGLVDIIDPKVSSLFLLLSLWLAYCKYI